MHVWTPNYAHMHWCIDNVMVVLVVKVGRYGIVDPIRFFIIRSGLD